MIQVKDIIIKFAKGPSFDVRAHAVSKGYTLITVSTSCNGLWLTALGSTDPEIADGETYFPNTNIWRVAVDWLPGIKRQG